MGTIVDFFKHEGTTDRERERLKMSVKNPTSRNEPPASWNKAPLADVIQIFEEHWQMANIKPKYK